VYAAGKGVEVKQFIKAMLLWLAVCPLFYKRKRFVFTDNTQRSYDWTPYVEGVKNVAVDPRLLDDTDTEDFAMSRGGTD
jgi:hypothetical protein